MAEARTQLVPRDGVGFVLSFEVRSAFASKHPSAHIEPQDMGDLEANMTTAFMQKGEYRAPCRTQTS